MGWCAAPSTSSRDSRFVADRCAAVVSHWPRLPQEAALQLDLKDALLAVEMGCVRFLPVIAFIAFRLVNQHQQHLAFKEIILKRYCFVCITVHLNFRVFGAK